MRALACAQLQHNTRRQPTPRARHLVEKLNKKSKAANVKPFMVKNHLWVFINTQIENPAFDSQVRARQRVCGCEEGGTQAANAAPCACRRTAPRPHHPN
jgi:hypothetical protein